MQEMEKYFGKTPNSIISYAWWMGIKVHDGIIEAQRRYTSKGKTEN
jgi:hypothetical protein